MEENVSDALLPVGARTANAKARKRAATVIQKNDVGNGIYWHFCLICAILGTN